MLGVLALASQWSAKVIKMSNQRSISLDVMRIFAALWVMIHHWTSASAFMLLIKQPYSVSWVPSALNIPLMLGSFGVDVFFILSGIVISRSAIGRDWHEFAVARFLRLYPAYFIATALAVLIAPFTVIARIPRFEGIASLTGLQWFFGLPTIVGPAWTLIIEVQFYMLVAVFLLLFGRGVREKLLTAVKVWLLALLLIPSLGEKWITFLLLGEFGPYFALGALLGLCRNFDDLKRELPALCIATFAAWVRLYARMSDKTLVPEHALIVTIILGSVLAIAIWSIHAESRRQPAPSQARQYVIVAALASYPLYLLHAPLGMPFIGELARNGISVPVATFLVGIFIVALSLIVTWAEPSMRRFLKSVLFSSLARREHQTPSEGGALPDVLARAASRASGRASSPQSKAEILDR